MRSNCQSEYDFPMSEELKQRVARAVRHAMDESLNVYNYNPQVVKKMLQSCIDDGQSEADAAVNVSTKLINADDPDGRRHGFAKMAKKVDKPGQAAPYEVTLEWLVNREEFRPLFSEEIRKLAEARLRKHFGLKWWKL